MTYESKKCPLGHYCLVGAEYPTRCPAGTYTSGEGVASAAECTRCKAGYYCIENDATMRACPVGHYCPEGTNTPFECPRYTFNPNMMITDRA